MHSRVTRPPRLAAGVGAALVLGAITVLAAGCAASGSSSVSSTSGAAASGDAMSGSSMSAAAGGSAPAAQSTAAAQATSTGQQSGSARQALELAAQNSRSVTSYAATVNLTGTKSGGNIDMSGSLKYQSSPSLRIEADFPTYSDGGQSVAGGVDEILTSSALYLKMPSLRQALHTSKPWAKMSLSSASTSGLNLSSLINQAKGDSPLAQTQLLANSGDVRTVGQTVIDGVPVTEYAGSYSVAAALAALPADERAQFSNAVKTGGFTTAQFEIWLDSQDLTRKIIVTENGSIITETITETVISINQPVSIQLPSAAETYVIPAGQGGGNNPS